MRYKHHFRLLALFTLTTVQTPLSAQTNVFQISKKFDSTEGPGAVAFPGFHGGFRQQILISSSRLVGLTGKTIRGIWVRRDLFHRERLTGGSIDIELRLSRANTTPGGASPIFALNVPKTQSVVFKGRIVIPTSPALGATVTPWSTPNSVKIMFGTAFRYQGGDICMDVVARPVAGSEPLFWFIDYERGSDTGKTRAFGTSCSDFADTAKHSLFANRGGLQIGNTMRLMALGRPGSTPLFLLGASEIRGGVDLSAMGATGCRQHIAYFLITPLRYSNPTKANRPASLYFELQIPADINLLGRSVFTQFADDELALSAPNRTNAAGLTTSNGLELIISSINPDLGMSTVTSEVVHAFTPMPSTGRVNVSMAPVLRLLY
jgi:hypothetical protein